MIKKTRVLHVLNTGSYSGAENVVITLINHMKLKYDLDFAYASPRGTIEKVLEKNNILYFPIDECNSIYNHSIKKVVKQFKPDIVHAHDFRASIVCAFSRLKTPIISHLHNNSPWIKKYGILSYLYLVSTIKYKKILLVSNAINKEYVFSRFINNKMITIGNPIDIELVRKKATEKEIKEEFDVIFLGRLSLQKNPVRFINIISKLKEKKSKLKVAMVGNGELEKECKIKELSLENTIKMFGFMENPYPILKNSKVLCMTSNWEGYGLVAVEALALGVPVVTTSVGGLRDIVTNQCGLICRNNIEFITEMGRIVIEDDYQVKKANGALERIIDISNIQDYCKNLLLVYKEIKMKVCM